MIQPTTNQWTKPDGDGSAVLLRRATDICLLVFLAYGALPETIIDQLYLGPLPLEFGLFYLCLTLGIVNCFVTGLSKVCGVSVMIAGAAGLYMVWLGLRNQNETHYLAIDVTFYLGLLFGLLWASQRSSMEIVRAARRWLLVSAALLLFNLVGLLTGIVPAAKSVARVYTYSLFESCLVVSCLFPLVMSTAKMGLSPSAARRMRVLAVAAIGVSVAAAVFSVTRSTFIMSVFSLATACWLCFSPKAALRASLVVLIVGVGLWTSVLDDLSWNEHFLVERLETTYLEDEIRFEELLWMFDDLQGSMLVGKGFGSRFVSCIGQFDGYAFMPHIGIMTLAYKGGLPLFAMLIIVPIVVSGMLLIPRLGVAGKNDPRGWVIGGSCACVLVYVAQASMSSGWSAAPLFLASAAFQMATRLQLFQGQQVCRVPHWHADQRARARTSGAVR